MRIWRGGVVAVTLLLVACSSGGGGSTASSRATDPSRVGLAPVLAVVGCEAAEREGTTPGVDGTSCYRLGPVIDGRALEDAVVTHDSGSGDWTVRVSVVRSRRDAVAALFDSCFEGLPTCPSSGPEPGSVAVVLDDVVIMAPAIQASGASLVAEPILIAGHLTKQQAEGLADAVGG